MSRRHSPEAFYGISVVRASPFWSGQAGPRGLPLSGRFAGSPLALLRARGTGGPEARALRDDLGGAVSEAVQRAVGEEWDRRRGPPIRAPRGYSLLRGQPVQAEEL